MNKITVKPNSEHIRTIGRTVYRNDILYLGFSCTAAEFNFTGKSISAEITTDWVLNEPWQAMFQAYAAVFVNDVLIKRFPIESGTNSYEIFSADKETSVKICIMKMSENAFDKMGIVSLSSNGNITPTVSKKSRRIEFIGDSITCGFGIEGVFGKDAFSTKQENPYENYAALTARHFNAEFHLVSWTSIGVISNSVPEDSDEPETSWLMPELYDYTDRGTESFLGIPDDKKEIWDNSRFSPQLIVVNLGTNDNLYTRGIPEREKAFLIGYKKFIGKIRSKNPQSVIICALGAMGQELCPQIETAVSELHDENIHSIRFDVQREEDGIGAENHPSLATHKKMSQKLISEINRIMKW